MSTTLFVSKSCPHCRAVLAQLNVSRLPDVQIVYVNGNAGAQAVLTRAGVQGVPALRTAAGEFLVGAPAVGGYIKRLGQQR